MNRSRITAIVVIIAVILAVVVLLIGKNQNNVSDSSFNDRSQTNQNLDDQPVKLDFTPSIPLDAKITEPDQKIISNDKQTKTGFFKLNISSEGYNPSTIVVKRGDLVNIEITSKENNYDIFLPGSFYLFIPRGGTKTLAFETNAYPVGTYNFRCRDYCPINKIINGSLIIKP
ncbi:MAG: hypothetical protein QMD50_00200 [Patescibacteria group bacterium]|nr:hypothetical protein [Patescibacteria group bacterium]